MSRLPGVQVVVVGLLLTVAHATACTKKRANVAGWEVGEQVEPQRPPVTEGDEPDELQLPPAVDRPEPNWDNPENLIVHSDEERTSTSGWACGGRGMFGRIEIHPYSGSLSLTEPDEVYRISPIDYRVRIRFPDYADEWHEFEVKSDFADCRLSGEQEGWEYKWHVPWGQAVVVVAPSRRLGMLYLSLYPEDCEAVPPDDQWYRQFAYGEFAFMTPDGSDRITHAGLASKVERPRVDALPKLIFSTPTWGAAWCPDYRRSNGGFFE